MGFIDRMAPPTDSDLYRFASPDANLGRLAAQDLAATARNAAGPAATAERGRGAEGSRGQGAVPLQPSNPQALPQSPTVNPQPAIPAIPGQRRILTSQEWVRQNYPDVIRDRFLSPGKRKHILEGYKLYLAVQEMGMRERMSQFHAKMRAAELGERRAGRVSPGAGRQPAMPGNIAGQMGYAHLTGVEPEKITALQAILDQVYAPKGSTGTGVDGKPAGDMWPKGWFFEKVAGEAGPEAGGLLQRMRESPGEWLAVYREFEGLIPYSSERSSAAMRDSLVRSAPSVEEVLAAEEEGGLSAEEAVAILEMILPPEQFEKYKEQASRRPPKRSFWDKLLPGPSAPRGPGKVTPY